MAPIINLISVDLSKKPSEQSPPVHNRWHPGIPHVAEVETGTLFRTEALDWTGGQVKNDDSADDIKNIDLSCCHHLTGPIRVSEAGKPALPGDLLVVEIVDIGCLPGHEWGYTGIFARENGGGFLTDVFPEAGKAIWDLAGRMATSRHIPGVSIAGLIHPGLIGTQPSPELLDIWNARERRLVEEGPDALTLAKHLHTRPLAALPGLEGALMGSVKADEQPEEYARLAGEGARTIPGRENGGNCDIKNLSIGSKLYLPVFVEGAGLSYGDIHFSQGDGEVSFCGAIEMPGYMVLNTNIIRGGVKMYLEPRGPSPLNVYPIFELGQFEPRYSEWLVFEGQSVDAGGKQHFLDASISYKMCVLNCIDYFSKFGYTKRQIYLLLSCCPCEGRISGIVDVPNCCTTLAVPTRIFDQDVRPKTDGPPVGPRLITRGDCPSAS